MRTLKYSLAVIIISVAAVIAGVGLISIFVIWPFGVVILPVVGFGSALLWAIQYIINYDSRL